MAKKMFLGVAVIVVMMFSSCVTMEIIDGKPVDLGIVAKSQMDSGAREISSFWTIGPIVYGYNGFLRFGYEKFAQEVAGQTFDIQIKQYWFGMIYKTSAFSK